MSEISDRENELLLKLFTKYHLSVPERKEFPNEEIAASKVRQFIQKHLAATGWFPGNHSYPVGDSGGEYTQLEAKEGMIVLHFNFESSYLRYSHKTENFNSLQTAIDTFLKAREQHEFDGLSIDWES